MGYFDNLSLADILDRWNETSELMALAHQP